MLHGCLAAAVTPLRDGGNSIDEDAIPAVVEFLRAGGVDGVLALGTTGEGMLLSAEERRRTAEAFVASAHGLDVAVHCGAISTRDAASLAAHAASIGAAAVAAMGPPFVPLDERALTAHFAAVARACAPLPFYLYEFASRTGTSIPRAVVDRLRELAPNLTGVKVSNPTWESFAPFLDYGLDVFVGPEVLIQRGLSAGAKGAVSGLAAAFPDVVSAHVQSPSEPDSRRVASLRASFQGMPFPAAAKGILARRGVPVHPDVRGPLRELTAEEWITLDGIFESWRTSSSRAPAR